MTLRVFLQAAGQSPGTIGAAFGPAGTGGPNRLRSPAVREWQIRTMRIVAPRRRLSVDGSGRARGHQNADKQEP